MIFSSNASLRLHEIRMKLQQKFGPNFEKLHTEIIKPFFENSVLFNQGKPNELGKQVFSEVNARMLFIEKHVDDLSKDYLIELSKLLSNLNDCWLFIPTETLDKIKTALLLRKDEISPEIFTKFTSSYQKITVN